MLDNVKLNRNHLKLWAVMAMVVDHVAWGFIPTVSVLGVICHFIGRSTGPIMAYFIAQGYVHTHDKMRYGLRLGIFALLSELPYRWYFTQVGMNVSFGSVMSTFFLAFILLCVLDSPRTKLVKGLYLVAACMLSLFMDHPIVGILWPVLFYVYRDDQRRGWFWYGVMTIIVFGSCAVIERPAWVGSYYLGYFVPPFLISRFYDGEPGKRTPLYKWAFYLAYPLHLAVFGAVYYCLM